jgi:hypothetical protein
VAAQPVALLRGEPRRPHLRRTLLHVQYARRPVAVRGREAHSRPVHRQPDLSGAEAVLGLQRLVGNNAVQRLIRLQRDGDRDAAQEQQVATSIAGGDWAGAANVLLRADERWMVRQLHNLDADQLRYLDDAVRRMGVKNSRLRIFIKAGLMQLGASDDTSIAGAGYGEIEGKATAIKNGRLRANGNNDPASYKFEITFMPNAAVDATLIEFIQMARVVSTAASTPDPVGVPNPDNRGANGTDRQTADHARVDRVSGMDYGWIGVRDSGLPGAHLRPWQRGSRSPAWMSDTPSRSIPNVAFEFETAAICRQGHDEGKVYATVQWGFTIDANMKVLPKDARYFNKESSEFDLAVAFWNAEATTGGSTQHTLPENLH